MGFIHLDDVSPGMILAQDVTGPSARVLLPVGSELTTAHLRLLRLWGVSGIHVDGWTQADSRARAIADLEPAQLDRIDPEIDTLFRHTDRSHPAIQELMALVTLRLIHRADRGSR